MSQGTKSTYYRALKAAGVEFPKHYREYNTAELQEMFHQLRENGVDIQLPEPEPKPETSAPLQEERKSQASSRLPVQDRPAEELPGERALQSREPIRQDSQGRVWYQEEVRKPAFPKPRGRRVLRYLETGVKRTSVQSGEYTESFEVAGDERTREAEVKITLPSYQVGLYKDPRFPFLIHEYNSQRGFDYFEVNKFYGGEELVPDEIKKIYVQNVLCYDMRTVIRAITTEDRQRQLSGGRF